MAEDKLPGAEKKLPAGILALLVSALAIHRFYLGDPVGGIIRICLNIACGAGALISFIEGIIYLTKSDEDFVATYIQGDKKWF